MQVKNKFRKKIGCNFLSYKVLPFQKLKYYKKYYILSLRNHRNIRKYMVNKNPIDVKRHFIFLKNRKKSSMYYLVSKGYYVLGVFYVKILNKDSCEVGLYLNPRLIGKRKGKILFKIIENIVKESFKRKKIKLFVDKNNKRAIKFYLKLGFNILGKKENFIFMEKYTINN